MTIESTALTRFGAWGQVVTVALGIAASALGLPNALLAACVGYLLVTMVGIVGIVRTESGIGGPIAFPFLVPGFLPLYYVATR